MLYTDSEKAWIERRGAEIAAERGWPLPIAESEASAELSRGRYSGREAQILPFTRPLHPPHGTDNCDEGH